MAEKIEFKDKKISREDLDRILEAGRLSPTAKSLQPQKIFVVESKKGLDKIQKLTKYKSPTVLMVCGDIEKCYKDDRAISYIQDGILVSLHMVLEATYLGIDNIYKDYRDYKVFDKIEEEFGFNNNIRPVSLIFLGYTTDDSASFKASDFNCNLLSKRGKTIVEIVEYI